MSKKTYIIIFVVLSIILAVLIGYYFTRTRNPQTDGGITNVFKNFFPFGGEDGGLIDNNNFPEENPIIDEEENTDFQKRLRKISSEPVAGAGVLDIRAGTIVRYIEKATGHIFEVELFSPRQGRISNTTIPRIYDAVWGNNGNSIMARYLKDDDETVDTFSITLGEISTTTENTVSGIAFPANIYDLSVFNNSVFYIEKSQNGSIGYTSNFSGGNRILVINSPVKEFNSQYVNSRIVALNTKPEEGTDGFLYFLDVTNASFRKILGNIKGLSSLVNNNASKILYLRQGSEFNMFLYDNNQKTNSLLTPETFPEKCVWSNEDTNIIYCAVPRDVIRSGSLTNWYKGLVQYSDDVWVFDTLNLTSQIISNLESEGGEAIDVIKPILSTNEQFLVFINKRDGSLWSLDLTK